MKKITRLLVFLSLSFVAACGGQNRTGSNNGEPVYDTSESGTVDPLEYDLTIPDGDVVYFKTNRSDLSLDAQNILKNQAKWLQLNKDYTVLAEGHADERGTRVYNLALGARRASAVRDYFVSQGVSDERIKIVSFGKERPVALCSAERCWKQNRRVVGVLSKSTPANNSLLLY